MSFSNWSTTNASNTSVGSISIAEGCPPGNLNDAAREIMAELAAAFGPGFAAFAAFFQAIDLPTARVALKALGSEGLEQMTGNLVRASAGPHIYHAAAGMTSGRIFVTPASASDPTSLPGDIWMTY